MGHTGLGCSPQVRSRLPRVRLQQPPACLKSPRLSPAPPQEDTLGWAPESREADGLTACDRLMVLWMGLLCGLLG
jgi:hypothetical protein